MPNYEILGVIGAGGMGIVYKGRHRELRRTVAIKMLGRGWELDRDSRERFRTEAEAVARLQHPNIIQLFELGTCDRNGSFAQPYMALEYVEGGSLARCATTPQDPKFAAKLVEKIARATDAAHKVGVVHRDLKPANVLLTIEEEPKIADFGLAKHLEPSPDDSTRYQTQTGIVIGTPEYMAPEQIDGKPPSPSMDIYAIGVILYELLTGRVPFKGNTPTETLLMARMGEPVAPRHLRGNLPRDLDTICLKCLEKKPERRYASAKDLADDLGLWSAGKSIRAVPVGRLEKSVRWARRNPSVAGLLASIALIVILGVLLVTWKWREAEQTAAVERWERYRANVRSASTEMNHGNASAASRALQDSPLEHRGWEWSALNAQLDWSSGSISVPEMLGARFSRNRREALTFGFDPHVRLINLQTGEQRVWPGNRHNHVYSNMDVDARAVILAGNDHVIHVHPLADGQSRTFTGHTGTITGVFLTANERMMSSSLDGTLRLWNATTGQQLASYQHSTPLVVVGLSDDARRAIARTPDRSTIVLWEPATGRFQTLPEGKGCIAGRFSPNGRWYALGAEYPRNEIVLYDCDRGELAEILVGHTNSWTSMVFSPDSNWLLTGSMDRTARLWNIAGAPPRQSILLGEHRGWVNYVAISPDGTRLATAGTDKTVRLWNSTGKLLARLTGHSGDVTEVGFAPDGKTLYSASGHDHTIRTWNLTTVERRGQLRGHDSFVYDVAFHPDGNRVFSASWDGTAAAWDISTGSRVKRYIHRKVPSEGTFTSDINFVNALAIHPGGRYLATSTRRDGVWLWDIESEQPLHHWAIETNDWRVCQVAFSPDGRVLVCGDQHGRAHVYSFETREKLSTLEIQKDVVSGIAYSPNGRWVATASGKTVRIWSTTTWNCLVTMESHQDRVNALAFSPDSRTLASASADRSVRLHDTENWSEIAALPHGVRIHSVTFSPDGKRLATGCDGGAIRIWDVQRRQEMAELIGHEDYVRAVAFSADGSRLVSGSGDCTLRVWETVPIQESNR